MMMPVIYAGLAVASFTSLVFITRRPFTAAGRMIILFMFFLSFPMLIKTGIFGPLTDGMMFVRAFPLVFGPFLFLYAKAETGEMPRFSAKFLLHFIPFATALILLIVIGKGDDNRRGGDPGQFRGNPSAHEFIPERPGMQPDRDRENFSGPDHPPMHPGGHPAQRDISPEHQRRGPEGNIGGRMRPPGPHDQSQRGNRGGPAGIVIAGLVAASFIFYTILIVILLRRHYKKISEYFSYDSIALNLKWLKWITICFFLAYGFVFTASVLSPAYIMHPLLDPFYAPDAGTTFFIIAFSLFAMKQPEIFKGDDTAPESEVMGDVHPEKRGRLYEKSGLKDSDAESFLKQLEEFMKTEKPYLDPDLTIVDLSEKLNIPKHYLTEIINTKYDKNFFMYINEFRIGEAKNMISDEKFRDYSIIRIAYDCGFNSKSTFNTVFKKFTGVTPTDYRQMKMV